MCQLMLIDEVKIENENLHLQRGESYYCSFSDIFFGFKNPTNPTLLPPQEFTFYKISYSDEK